jgi:hypothetical protein
MSDMPWQDSGSFHIWLLSCIDNAVDNSENRVRVSGVTRALDDDDFGFSSKTLNKWRKERPDDPFPDGKKMKDIVFSRGFPLLARHDQRAIICQWIREELEAESVELSDELIGTLISLTENSTQDFLLERVTEVRAL